MISASLKMVVLFLALVAGGFAVGGAASASQAVAPCHAGAARHVAVRHASAPGPQALAAPCIQGAPQSHHHHGTGCPTDGTCCDAFCHAVMTASVPETGVLEVTFASFIRSDDADQGSLPVRGPERPPRTAAI